VATEDKRRRALRLFAAASIAAVAATLAFQPEHFTLSWTNQIMLAAADLYRSSTSTTSGADTACSCDGSGDAAPSAEQSGTCPSCSRPAQAATNTDPTDPNVVQIEIHVPPFPNVDGMSIEYNIDEPTERNYEILSYNYTNCTSKYAQIRASLDYEYHSHYNPSRQKVQDAIIDHLLNRTTIQCSATGRSCSKPHDGNNFIVFTAGVFGAGKTHTVRLLSERGRFPLAGFVSVDPDEIRRHLPEFRYYVKNDAEKAGEMTRKESGLISEVLAGAALIEGRNVLVDGSLRDHEWYALHFDDLRQMHPNIRIAILHVTAPRSAIYENVVARSRVTGRVVPRDKLEIALKTVPQSVKRLGPLADFFCELWNSPEEEDVHITTDGIGWKEFTTVWNQKCPPDQKEESDAGDEMDASSTAKDAIIQSKL
jgi:predicted kinase